MDKMPDSYRTILGYGVDEIDIKKSRFIGYSKPVSSEEEAIEFIEEINEKHRDATHNCTAYVFGPNSNIQRFDDDGEPSGTAGIPILETIKKEDLRNLVVVVTRYFGGIKLGGGGLIRAYTRGAKIALDAGRIVDMVSHTRIRIRIEYTLYGMIENYLLTEGYIIEDSLFDDNVNLDVYVSYDKIDYFISQIKNLTSARAEINKIDKKHLPIYQGKRIVRK